MMPATSPSVAVPAVPDTPTRWLVVVFGILVIMVDGFDLQAIGFVAPDIARNWSLDISAFGPVFSAGLAGSMLGAMAAGPLARHVGSRVVLVLSLLLFGGVTLATVRVADLPTLALLRFMVGLGVGAAVPVVMNMVADNSAPRLRATLVVAILCGQPVGAIFGGALCARYMPIYGWPFAFALGGVLPLLLTGPVLWLTRRSSGSVPSAAQTTAAKSAARLRHLFGEDFLKTTALVWLCAFLTVLFVYVIVSWLPGAVRTHGHSLKTSVLAISLFNFGGIAGAMLLGRLMDRYGPLKVIPFTYALAGASMATLDFSLSTPNVLLVAVFLSGLAGYGGAMSLGTLTLLVYPPSLRTTGVGWAMGVGRLGAAIGPLCAGVALAAGMEIGHLFYFAAAAAVLVALCLILLARAYKPTERSLSV